MHGYSNALLIYEDESFVHSQLLLTNNPHVNVFLQKKSKIFTQLIKLFKYIHVLATASLQINKCIGNSKFKQLF